MADDGDAFVQFDDENYVPYVSVKERLAQKRQKLSSQQVRRQPVDHEENKEENVELVGPKAKISLVDQTNELRKTGNK